MLELPKAKINHKSYRSEQFALSSAIGMALMESIGIRKLIDSRCGDSRSDRIVSPGMAVKALIGPTFNLFQRPPLSRVNAIYGLAPTDRLFGNGAVPENLNDDALGRCLDDLSELDLELLFHECSEMAVKKFGFESPIRHGDSTNFSFYGEKKDVPDGEISPEYGKSKTGRDDLLQYALQITTDSNRIIRTMRPYKGNAADSTMDGDTLEFFGEHLSAEERSGMVFVADSKMATEGNVRKVCDLGMGVVTKCPVKFGDGFEQRAFEMSKKAEWHRYDVKDHGGEGTKYSVMLCDLDLEASFGTGKKHRSMWLRAVVFRRPDEIGPKTEGLKDRFRRLEKRYDDLGRKTFDTKKEAIDAFKAIRPGSEAFRAVPCYTEDKVPGALAPGSRRGVNEERIMNSVWKVKVDSSFDAKKASDIVERACTRVLVTNLPHFREGTDGVRRSARAEDVFDLYMEEYVVESSFRFLKSGLAIDHVYLQNPSRERAMMFVLCIEALVTNIADAVFRRMDLRLGNRPLTFYNFARAFPAAVAVFDRDECEIGILINDDDTKYVFKVMDALGIDPQLLFGYLC